MKKNVAFILFYLIFLTAYGQVDRDFLRIRSEADQWMLVKKYADAKAKYSLALKIKTNDAYCKQRLEEIDEKEAQLKKNKQDRLRQDRSNGAQGGNFSSTPYYGTLKGIYDDNNEKFDYTGYILKKRPHGIGRADYHTYSKTAGWEEANWVNGKKNGAATAKYPNGSRYEANYKNDKLDGKFHSFLKDSTLYEQFYKDGKLVGVQKIYHPDGTREEVESENGKMEGCATAYTKEGHRGTGYFQNGDVQGEITLHLKDGTTMIGIYKHGALEGPIKLYLPDGDRFEGEMKNNMLFGKGIKYLLNGEKVEAVFENGVITGDAVWTYPNGDKYVGQLRDYEKSGYGKFSYVDGMYYEGYWIEDNYHGLGRFTVPSNKHVRNCPKCITYEGEWKAGLKDGYGKCYDGKGRLLYEGKFVKDKPKDRYPKK